MHSSLRGWLEASGRTRLLLAALVLAVLAGLVGVMYSCQKSPRILDNSRLVVQAGLGISNLCEVGMSFSQIKEATGDATDHGSHYEPFWRRRLASWGRGEFVIVPSLGAIASIGENQPTALITFYVSPYRAPSIPGLEIREPFQGKLDGNLSFKDRPVSKAEVENVFGTVNQVATNVTEALVFRTKGTRFTLQLQGDADEGLWYPDKGVAFMFTSNVVTSFQVYRASGTPQ